MPDLATAAMGAGVVIYGVWNGVTSLQAKRAARQARDNAHPVSNGWGSKVSGDLTYLRASLDQIHERMNGADQRQTAADQRANRMATRVDEAASHARTAAEQSSAVAAGLAAHLADHAHAAARA